MDVVRKELTFHLFQRGVSIIVHVGLPKDLNKTMLLDELLNAAEVMLVKLPNSMYSSGKRGRAFSVLQRYMVLYKIQDVMEQALSFVVNSSGMVSCINEPMAKNLMLYFTDEANELWRCGGYPVQIQ